MYSFFVVVRVFVCTHSFMYNFDVMTFGLIHTYAHKVCVKYVSLYIYMCILIMIIAKKRGGGGQNKEINDFKALF